MKSVQLGGLVAACIVTLAPMPSMAIDQPVAGACDRSCLKQLVDRYLDALPTHDPSGVPLAADVRFTENGNLLWPGEGIWRTAGPSRYRLYALDAEGGEAAAEAVLPVNGKMETLLLRLKVEGGKIVEVETILCGAGGAALFAPENLVTPPVTFSEAVPDADRSTRGELLSVANAYFQAIETEGTPVYQPAPFVPETVRVENGVQTTNASIGGSPKTTAAEQLDMGLFKGIRVAFRRYPVVDVTNGVVLGVVMFQAPVRPASAIAAPPGAMPRGPDGPLLLAEMFKVSGGKIRQIQAVMVNRPPGSTSGWN